MAEILKKLIETPTFLASVLLLLLAVCSSQAVALGLELQLGGSASKQNGSSRLGIGESIWANFLVSPKLAQLEWLSTSVGLNVNVGANSSPQKNDTASTNIQRSDRSKYYSAGVVVVGEFLNLANGLSFYLSPTVGFVRSKFTHGHKKLNLVDNSLSSISYTDSEYRGLNYGSGLGASYTLAKDIRIVGGVKMTRTSLRKVAARQSTQTQSKASLRSPRLSLADTPPEAIRSGSKINYSSLSVELGLSYRL